MQCPWCVIYEHGYQFSLALFFTISGYHPEFIGFLLLSEHLYTLRILDLFSVKKVHFFLSNSDADWTLKNPWNVLSGDYLYILCPVSHLSIGV